MKFLVEEEYNGSLLFRFVQKQFENLYPNKIIDYIEEGRIKVNGEIKDKDYRVSLGDAVEASDIGTLRTFYELSPEEREEIKKGIVYENNDIIVFCKSPGVVVHKGAYKDYALVDLLKAYTGNHNFAFVNRIDRDTEGLILGAKHLLAVKELSREIENKNIHKYYYILVNGLIAEDNFEIRNYLKKTGRKVEVVEQGVEGAKESISHFEVLGRGKEHTLLRAYLETGRLHQLRVQLSNIGHPIVGDKKYGKKEKVELCLFSYKIHIALYDNLEVEVEMPSRFKNYIDL